MIPRASSARTAPTAGTSTLPFLLKVLAADQPLSLQAHPSLAQARARVRRARRPPDSRATRPNRNYRDANHKPELICALTPFPALVGFRAACRHRRAAARAGVPASRRTSSCWPRSRTRDGLRALFTTWITLPQSRLDELVPAVPTAASGSRATGRWQDVARSVLELAERYPGDAGVLAALLLNRVTLAPGEALYLPAGNLHAYLSGAGVELMANSDNVLRGGLTPKHVDVPELLRVLDFHAQPPPVLTGVADGDWVRYDTPGRGVPAAPLRGHVRPGAGARVRPADPALHGGGGRRRGGRHGAGADQGRRGVAGRVRRGCRGGAAHAVDAALPRG